MWLNDDLGMVGSPGLSGLSVISRALQCGRARLREVRGMRLKGKGGGKGKKDSVHRCPLKMQEGH